MLRPREGRARTPEPHPFAGPSCELRCLDRYVDRNCHRSRDAKIDGDYRDRVAEGVCYEHGGFARHGLWKLVLVATSTEVSPVKMLLAAERFHVSVKMRVP